MTISRLARGYGLSRSTLLYYDRIRLLRASDRSPAGYRRYSAADLERLARIVRYRKAGLPLASIRGLLDSKEGGLVEVLTARLEALNVELRRLRGQQRFIMELAGDSARLESLAFMSRSRFVSMLHAAGLTRAAMARWHASFERSAPREHQAFLEFLCLRDEEIGRIRREAARAPHSRRSARTSLR